MTIVKRQFPCSSWGSEFNPSAVLLCIHGLGLHSLFYKPLAEILCRHRIKTYALDVRGFGSWKAENVLLNFEQSMDDIASIIRDLRQKHPGVPIFLFGESMGGAVATRFTALHESLVDGLILCAPARTLYEHKLGVMQTLLELIKRPGAPLDIGKQLIERATMHQRLRQDWLNDALARLHFSAQELFHMQDFFEASARSAHLISQTPVMIIQGFADRLICPKGTVTLYEMLRTRDKDLVILGDAEHLIFQNPDPHQRAVTMVVNWITDHSQFCALDQAI